MEHIIQFGIGIDDDSIREVIESKAEKEIMEELKTAATRAVFKYDEWRRQPTRCPTEFFAEHVDAFLDQHGDFSVIVEFDEKIGYGIVGRNHGGRPGCCAYGNPEHLCLIPSAPSIKFSFEDIFEAF